MTKCVLTLFVFQVDFVQNERLKAKHACLGVCDFNMWKCRVSDSLRCTICWSDVHVLLHTCTLITVVSNINLRSGF